MIAIAAVCALHCAACTADDDKPSSDAGSDEAERFSFFVSSFKALQALSGNEAGFGGDLRFGETGPGAGLRGADKICSTIADRSLPGSSSKRWRAFLSVTADENGEQVNAIDRIGDGPWYDRVGRLLAETKADLMYDRPQGADTTIAHDFPNEDGVPNQKPDPDQPSVDNHDILTGTNSKGELFSQTATCKDWTSAIGDPESEGRPHVGHSWDRMASDQVVKPPDDLPEGAMVRQEDGGVIIIGPMKGSDGPPPEGGIRTVGGPGEMGGPGGLSSGHNWMSALDEAGCAAGVNLIQDGPPKANIPTVGSGGGYGGIYCFALTP